MNNLERILRECGSMAEYGRRYAEYLGEVLRGIDYAAVEQMVGILERAWQGGQTAFVAGNGGSAATASHWALDLGVGTRVATVPSFRVLSLTDHTPLLTALANDRSFDDVIVGQLEGLFQPGDVLVVISASGNSPNILRAVEFVNARGGTTVGLTGFDGGQLKTLCHLCVHVPTPIGEYGPVEDAHLILGHILTSFLRGRRSGAAGITTGAPRAEGNW